MRLRPWSELRHGKAYRALRRVLSALLGAVDYRICHISIQRNHIHLIIEAAAKRALQRCVQRFTIRAARVLQPILGWSPGNKVFAYRYHSKPITTARQARCTLAYVLNNWRRHREDVVTPVTRAAKLDPYSSGISFEGWIGGGKFVVPEYYVPLPVSPPESSMLRYEWKRHGLIDPFERPGPLQ